MRRTFRPRLSLHSSLSLSTDLSSQVSPSSSSHAEDLSTESSLTAPQLTKTHLRRMTYAGDLALALGNESAIQEYEERIALLESQNARISVELRATRDALTDEREDRRIERQSVIMLSGSSSASGRTDSIVNEHSEILYERKMRMEILESLKKVRAENMTISRSLRECQDNYASLSSVLEVEQREKEDLREEIKKLTQKNFMLFEHNKLLAGRDSALQDQISSLMTKSQADDWMRSVLEEELQAARHSPTKQTYDYLSAHVKRNGASTPSITLEHQGPLRAQLVTACDELHVARRCVEASEKRCEELESRVSSIQREMSQCLDSSAQALDVERELRAEVEEYARQLEEENARLKDEVHPSHQKDLSVHGDSASTNNEVERVIATQSPVTKLVELSEAHIPHKIICGDVQKITVDVRNVTMSPAVENSTTDSLDMPTSISEVALKARRRERLLERQLRLTSSKRLARRRSSMRTALFATVASPTLTDFPVTVFQAVTLGSTTPFSPVAAPACVDCNSIRNVSQPSSPVLPFQVAEAPAHATRHDSLKPLQLSSIESVSSSRSSSPAVKFEVAEVAPVTRPNSLRPPQMSTAESMSSSRSSSPVKNTDEARVTRRKSMRPLQLRSTESMSSCSFSSTAINSEAPDTRIRRDSLRPLTLGSPESVSLNRKRLTLHNSIPSFSSRPKSVIEIPSNVPSSSSSSSSSSTTPRKENPARDSKKSARFRDDTPAQSHHPDSPDSTISTLVASSPASAHVDLRKCLMITTALSKKPSFDATLKTSTTLFLDERARSHLPTPTTIKSVQNYLPSPAHMRRASVVLATIAKSTGIGSFEDWFVV